MKEEFEKLVAGGKIGRPPLEPLLQLVQSGYCMHRSWGFGKIKAVDTVFARLTIAFPDKPWHSMDLGFASESLKAIPSDHILARKASDLQSLRQMAALHHLDLIKLVLQSFGGKATLEQIQQVLVPDIIADDWKKWWEVAKHELKKDGHFLVPVKKTDPIVYQAKEVSLQERLMGDFRAAKGLKARLTVANELLKNLSDLTDKATAVSEAVQMLNTEIASHQRTQPALALEAIFVRDELRLAKERSDAFADILGPEVFRAMLTAMERDQFNEKKSNKLRDYILDDQELIVELIESADLEVIKDLTRALQLSPCFDDMDKRSLLARIVKSYPAAPALISGEQRKQDSSHVVSWESLEGRKAESGELVHKKIPANSKEIAVARSYGDLRENHEYKSAKEMQKLLMRRKGELEDQLVRARGTDFVNPRTDVVSVGTVVRTLDTETNQPEVYTVLGAWDSEPEKGVVSYLSPVAQSLLNRKVGDQVEFEVHG